MLCTLATAVCVVVTPSGRWPVLAAFAGLLAVPMLLSRVPLMFALKRSLIAIPFAAVFAVFLPFTRGQDGAPIGALGPITVYQQGLVLAGDLLFKAWLASLALTILTSTTRFPLLLKALESLRLPRLLVTLLAFLYRYIWVLADEAMRLTRARHSRGSGGGLRRNLAAFGGIIGSLFVRTYERGERIYAAMLSRGFDGKSRTLTQLRLRGADMLASSAILACAVGLAIWGRMT